MTNDDASGNAVDLLDIDDYDEDSELTIDEREALESIVEYEDLENGEFTTERERPFVDDAD